MGKYKVYSYQCPTCQKEFCFDGRKFGILNFRNRHFFTVELFYSLLYLKINAGISTYSWWKMQREMVFQTIPDRDVATEYLRLMTQMGNSIHQYSCQFDELIEQPDSLYTCCQNPRIITLDGIVISVETERIDRQNLETPWVRVNPVDPLIKAKLQGRDYRSVIELNPTTAKEHRAFIKQVARPAGLLQSDFRNLINGRRNHPFFDFLNTVKEVKAIETDDGLKNFVSVPPILRAFIFSVGKMLAPCTSIVPRVVWLVLFNLDKSPTLELPSLNDISIAVSILPYNQLLTYLC